ncbi:MAG: hypothetical protein IIA50_03430 [Bacteroidetes bacterium]|nr:hypothetical protein [Bacteroidota bacterium]
MRTSTKRFPVLLFAFFGLLLSSSAVLAQSYSVANVRFEPDGTRVLVYYDLSGGDTYSIAVRVSLDGGVSFSAIAAVTGDVGDGIAQGPNKVIIWDVFVDFPDGVLSDAVVFDVSVALLKKKRSMMWVLAGALIAGAGGTAALLLGGKPSGSGGSPGNNGPTADTTTLPNPPARPAGN